MTSWGKFLLIAVVLYGAWTAFQANRGTGVNLSAAELSALAGSVKEGDVLMYTTTHCPYCVDAREWLKDNKFTFTECDTQVSDVCARAFDAIGGDGVPYLIVRGEHLLGFDPGEFVAALQK